MNLKPIDNIFFVITELEQFEMRQNKLFLFQQIWS